VAGAPPRRLVDAAHPFSFPFMMQQQQQQQQQRRRRGPAGGVKQQ
jgi:hypothetical protein